MAVEVLTDIIYCVNIREGDGVMVSNHLISFCKHKAKKA